MFEMPGEVEDMPDFWMDMQALEEVRRKTIIALAQAAVSPLLPDAGLDLLCYHCGISRDELQGVKVNGYSTVEMRRKAT